VVVLAIGVGMFYYITQIEEEGNVNVLTNNNTVVNTNSTANANVNTNRNVNTILNLNNMSNTNTVVTGSQCSDWKPTPAGQLTCSAEVSPGYYFNNERNSCEYYPGGGECSPPPYTTMEECQIACRDNGENSYNCTEVYCSQYVYSNCPDNCTKQQCESGCTEKNGAVVCATCDWPGSCFCEKETTGTSDCEWRPTQDYGSCEKALGLYYDGNTCVYISGCDTRGDIIPFHTIRECNDACNADKEFLFNGSVSKECTQDSDCKFVDNTYDYSECCDPAPVCTSDYDNNEYVVVNKELLEQLIIASRGDECDGIICPKYEMPVCPDVENKYIMQCIDHQCKKILKGDGVSVSDNALNVNSNINTNKQTNDGSAVNTQSYINKTCASHSDCGVFPCNNGVCWVKECTCSCRCPDSICGESGSAAPGYCITSST